MCYVYTLPSSNLSQQPWTYQYVVEASIHTPTQDTHTQERCVYSNPAHIYTCNALYHTLLHMICMHHWLQYKTYWYCWVSELRVLESCSVKQRPCWRSRTREVTPLVGGAVREGPVTCTLAALHVTKSSNFLMGWEDNAACQCATADFSTKLHTYVYRSQFSTGCL